MTAAFTLFAATEVFAEDRTVTLNVDNVFLVTASGPVRHAGKHHPITCGISFINLRTSDPFRRCRLWVGKNAVCLSETVILKVCGLSGTPVMVDAPEHDRGSRPYFFPHPTASSDYADCFTTEILIVPSKRSGNVCHGIWGSYDFKVYVPEQFAK